MRLNGWQYTINIKWYYLRNETAAVNEGGRMMPNVRSLNPIKYKMSENRFKEMYFHCLQYDEWKERSITDPQEEKREALKRT